MNPIIKPIFRNILIFINTLTGFFLLFSPYFEHLLFIRILGIILILIGGVGIVLLIRGKILGLPLPYDYLLSSWADFTKNLDLILILTVIIRFFLIQPFIVEGQSMEPNFHHRQYLLVDKISYRLRKPERGEVIIFVAPSNPRLNYIKRIIGLPGEEITFTPQAIFINGKKLVESYSLISSQASSGQEIKKRLGLGEYFVLGDNRNHSSDSREWGPLSREKIIGRAWLVLFTFSKSKSIFVPFLTK